jgi:hypothetical protein
MTGGRSIRYRLPKRPPPRLEVVIPLEGRPTLHVHADTHEDELRLWSWLRRSRALSAALRDLDVE